MIHKTIHELDNDCLSMAIKNMNIYELIRELDNKLHEHNSALRG